MDVIHEFYWPTHGVPRLDVAKDAFARPGQLAPVAPDVQKEDFLV